jgi:hypothetical protein
MTGFLAKKIVFGNICILFDKVKSCPKESAIYITANCKYLGILKASLAAK